ncbi:hypothetical protein SAMN05216176_11650 [Nitratireductor indicus]|nr:hypothetical protein SAMN05216176_11650 [Nitratireductor indicus]
MVSNIDSWCQENLFARCSLLSLLLRLKACGWCGDCAPAAPLYRVELDAEQAWKLASLALADLIPGLTHIIQRVERSTPRCLLDLPGKQSQPFTYHRGAGRLAFVSCRYQGRAGDLLAVAHEFAHAVQLAAARSSPPAVAREVCAFLGEYALLTWLNRNDSSLYAVVECAWHQENAAYLGGDAQGLLDALNDDARCVNYRWNYPPARLLAHAFRDRSAAFLEDLFRWRGRGEFSFSAIIADLSPKEFPRLLPALPTQSDKLSAYRQIGAMVLLDIFACEHLANENILIRYTTVFDQMRQGSVFIAVTPFGNPLGYATWLRSDEGCLSISETSLPDRQETLRSAFRKHKPEIAAALMAAQGGTMS